MNRDIDKTVKPITLFSAFGHSILDLDTRVWRNNYSILATDINPCVAPPVTARDNRPHCTASCSHGCSHATAKDY